MTLKRGLKNPSVGLHVRIIELGSDKGWRINTEYLKEYIDNRKAGITGTLIAPINVERPNEIWYVKHDEDNTTAVYSVWELDEKDNTSYFLTETLAKIAVNIVRPTLMSLLDSDQIGGKKDFHLIILDPINGDPLYEESFGEKLRWKRPFDQIASSKAQQCYRTKMSNREMHSKAPWLLKKGDTRFVGGVYYKGLVVAGSGLPDFFDEMIGWMVANAIQALCRSQINIIPPDVPWSFFTIANRTLGSIDKPEFPQE